MSVSHRSPALTMTAGDGSAKRDDAPISNGGGVHSRGEVCAWPMAAVVQ